ncbi:MAG: pyridine nucleotide-disulfide oxidoreductase [Clostridiaceae bacterium BRH_c20a]|nr:MAG: pyridine nucleotide-disulfide oxidoreductase [Clostridiaceae bacterium BRH_c20a]
MGQQKIVIIGGVAAGASAAAKARRDNEKAEIIIYEKGPYVSFANCGLPYYIGRDIKEREDLFLMTPDFFYERYRVIVKVNHEVVRIDRVKKQVEIKKQDSAEIFTDSYDKLVIATGGTPIKPPIPGGNLENIFTLFTVPDLDAIERALAMGDIEKVAIVGGGYIGLEATEAFLKRGKKVTLIEKMDQLLPYLDEDMAIPLAIHLENLGTRVILKNGVKEFKGEKRVQEIILENDEAVEADLVILAIGARPQLELIKAAGLKIGPAGGVEVDATLRTSDPDIYAGGDIIETIHLVTGRKVRIPLAGPANKQGRIIGANVVGGRRFFKGVLGTSIVKAGELTAAKTGIGEKEAKELGLAYFVSYTPSLHHAGYYPGARHLLIKLVVAEHSGKILGAQIVGWQGVDKRIDVLATAIHASMTVEDLEDLDLAYAPPYSSAKDPVTIAGFVAANILRGEIDLITPEAIKKAMAKVTRDDWQIIDVRTPQECQEEGSIPGAVFIPVDQLRERHKELNTEKKTALYCKVGYRSYLGYKILKDLGFKKVYNISGGYMGYKSDVGIAPTKGQTSSGN